MYNYDSALDEDFLERHGWGWLNHQHFLVDKGTGQPTHVTIEGDVYSSHLNIWTTMGANIHNDPEEGSQAIYLHMPGVAYSAQARAYERGLHAMCKIMSEATERWPSIGFFSHFDREIIRFEHQAFRDRRCENEDRRSQYKEDFFDDISAFQPPYAAQLSLSILADTHSFEALRVVYEGRMVHPKYWDKVVDGSLVRVTFQLSHKSTAITNHIFYGDVTHVEILRPAEPIDPDHLLDLPYIIGSHI